jgi:hypothetical protein
MNVYYRIYEIETGKTVIQILKEYVYEIKIRTAPATKHANIIINEMIFDNESYDWEIIRI